MEAQSKNFNRKYRTLAALAEKLLSVGCMRNVQYGLTQKCVFFGYRQEQTGNAIFSVFFEILIHFYLYLFIYLFIYLLIFFV